MRPRLGKASVDATAYNPCIRIVGRLCGKLYPGISMRAGVLGSPHYRCMYSLCHYDIRVYARCTVDARCSCSGARYRVRTRLLRYTFVYSEGRPSHSLTRSGMVFHRRRRREAGRFRRHGARGGAFGIERRGAHGERYLAKRGKRHILRRLVQRDVRAFSAERGLCRAVLSSRHRCRVISWSDRTTGQFSLSRGRSRKRSQIGDCAVRRSRRYGCALPGARLRISGAAAR